MANPHEKFDPFAAAASKKAEANLTTDPRSKVPANLNNGEDSNGSNDPKGNGNPLLDNMDEIWDTKPTEAAPFNKVKSEDLATLASKFKPNVDPELAAKAASGDAEALTELLSTVTQQAFKVSAEAANAMSAGYVTESGNSVDARMKAGQRREAVMQAVNSEIPSITKSKPMSSMVDDLSVRYLAKHPTATPKQAADAIIKHLRDDLGIQVPTAKPTEEDKSPKVDWTKDPD